MATEQPPQTPYTVLRRMEVGVGAIALLLLTTVAGRESNSSEFLNSARYAAMATVLSAVAWASGELQRAMGLDSRTDRGCLAGIADIVEVVIGFGALLTLSLAFMELVNALDPGSEGTGHAIGVGVWTLAGLGVIIWFRFIQKRANLWYPKTRTTDPADG